MRSAFHCKTLHAEAGMKLSGEQFQQIISQLVSDAPKTQNEQRREPRVGIRAQGFVTPWTLGDDAQKAAPVTIRDLSHAGICILTATPMARGTRFILRLLRLSKGDLHAHYEVRHCRTMAPTLFSVGAKLVNLTDADGEATAA
jgi:hypothetical protein